MVNKITNTIKKQMLANFRYYLGLMLVFILFAYTAYYARDPDFGWHLRAGEYFIRSGIPKTDIFTFTASNFAWINHEWLNDVLVHTLNGAGTKLLSAIVFSALWCLALYLAGRKKNTAVLLLASIAVLPFSGIRPIAWSVLFVALLERLNDSKHSWYQLLLPLIFLVWANLHGGFIFGLLLISIWQFSKKTRISWVLYFLSILAVFANPYYWRIFVEISTTLLDSQLKFRIAEWVPLNLPWVSVLYTSAFIITNFSVYKHPFRKLVSIPGLTLLMALSSIRHLPLFVITSLRYFEDGLTKLLTKLKATKISNKFMLFGYFCIFIFISVSGLLGAGYVSKFRRSENYYPSKAVAYIPASTCGKNIFNAYSFGGYLEEKLPSYKFYIDGRMPSWKSGSTSYFENYQKFINDESTRNEEIKKHSITCMIIEPNRKLEQSLKQTGWQLVKEGSGESYLLYKRAE